jgi:hypothetical protein
MRNFSPFELLWFVVTGTTNNFRLWALRMVSSSVKVCVCQIHELLISNMQGCVPFIQCPRNTCSSSY